jgi:hypothetical protein
MECYSSILSRTLRPPNGSFIESFVALNSMPHHQFCWRGEEREGGSFMGWVRSFIPMKLSRHSYLVLSLGNCAMKLCTGIGLRTKNNWLVVGSRQTSSKHQFMAWNTLRKLFKWWPHMLMGVHQFLGWNYKRNIITYRLYGMICVLHIA